MAFRDLLHTLDPTATRNPRPEHCIVEHLNWLLNTRRDRHPMLDGYGLPDMHEILDKLNADAIVAMEIRKVIDRYEPRLSQVSVQPEPGEGSGFEGNLHAHFVIEAVLAITKEYLEFRETAEIGHDGNVNVS